MKSRYLLLIVLLLSLLTLAVLAILVQRGVQRPQRVVPSQAVSAPGQNANPSDCQGNPNAPAKCFKCADRNNPGQIGILDFSCFAKWYGQSVGGQ